MSYFFVVVFCVVIYWVLVLWRILYEVLELRKGKEEDRERNIRGIVYGLFKSFGKNGKVFNYVVVMEINSFILKYLNSLVFIGIR